jgi:hypothetical protein
MTNKKIGFYFESSLPVIPSNDDFAFYYIKNEQQINGENKNIPDVYLYNKSLNQYFQINKPHNLDLRTINSLPILDNNIDLGLNDILNFNNGNLYKVISKDQKGIERSITVFARKFDIVPICSIGKVVMYSRCKRKLEENCEEYIKNLTTEYIPNKIKKSEKEIEKMKKILKEVNYGIKE